MADVLLIFDCCYAGHVAATRSLSMQNKIFEVLGACQPDEVATVPGPNSFTSALVWALKELATSPNGFTVSQLHLKLYDYGNLPDNQHPYFGEKFGFHSPRRLKIAPMPENAQTPIEDATLVENDKPIEYFLNMSLLYQEMPTKEDITELCEGLRQVVRSGETSAKTQTHQILWQGLFTKDKLRRDVPLVAENAYWRWKSTTLEERIRSALVTFPETTSKRSMSRNQSTIVANSSAMEKQGLAVAERQTVYEIEKSADGSNYSMHPVRKQVVMRSLDIYRRFKIALLLGVCFGIGYVWGEHREHLLYHSQFGSLLAGRWA